MTRLIRSYNLQQAGSVTLTISGSSIEYALLLIMNLFVAQALSHKDFGAVRAATAYLTVLQLFGHITLHESVAAQVARAQDPTEKQAHIRAGMSLIGLASLMLVLCSEIVLHMAQPFSSEIRWILQWLVLIVPFSSLYMLFHGILPADGRHRQFFKLRVVSGSAQLLVIAVMSKAFAVPGWLGARLLSL